MHAYWPFTEPLAMPGNGERAKQLLRRLSVKVGGDMAAAEPVRILRVPGTYNHKYDPPRPVEILRFEPSLIYTVSQLEDALSQVAETLSNGGSGAARPHFDTARSLIGVPEGERDNILFKLACKLRHADVPIEFSKKLIAEAARNCTPAFPEKSAIEKVDRAYRSYSVNQNTDFSDDETARPPVILNFREIIEMNAPPREFVLEPVFRARDINQVYAWRGTGKTQFLLLVAVAMASGGGVFRWRAPKPRKVLYIDGQMQFPDIQARLMQFLRGSDAEPDENYLRLLAADLQNDPIPNLSTPEGQEWIEPLLQDAEVIILDSISTLASVGKENDAESAIPLQRWLLRQRRAGRMVIVAHHGGKNGLQRGTSKREDILDISIKLENPPDYEDGKGCRFNLTMTKARGLAGAASRGFQARLVIEDGIARWTVADIERPQLTLAAELFNQGASIRTVATKLGITKWMAASLQKKAGERGLL
jgi:hypothetical protein